MSEEDQGITADFLTIQESMLARGSTAEAGHLTDPYTVVGVTSGLPIDMIREIREIEGGVDIFQPIATVLGLSGRTRLVLGPIDETGKATVNPPRFETWDEKEGRFVDLGDERTAKIYQKLQERGVETYIRPPDNQ